MRYWAPINSPGGILGNDPYINANPSIGVQGSIPTFQSFEQPLRGLQNLIVKSRFTPSGAINDLQIPQAIRSQQMNWMQTFGGSANALTCVFDPVAAALTDLIGVPIRGIAAAPNNGACTLQVNETPERPIVHPDGEPLKTGDIVAGQILVLCYDGTNYQLISMGPFSFDFGPGLPLRNPLILYVRTDGNDANDGTEDTPAKAFLTGQAAMNKAFSYGPGEHGVTIKFANGTYPGTIVTKQWQGPDITIKGNPANPALTILQAPGYTNCVSIIGINSVTVRDIKLVSLGPWGYAGSNGIGAGALAQIIVENVDFGYCGFAQMGGAGMWDVRNHSVSGSAMAWADIGGVGFFVCINRVVTIKNAVGYNGAFAYASEGGIIASVGCAWVNKGLVGGRKFICHLGAGIDTLASGFEYFPGTPGYWAFSPETGGWYN